MSLDVLLSEKIDNFRNINNFRCLDRFLERKFKLDFGNNDYLCLSQNKEVINNAQFYLEKYGTGGRASRLCVISDIYHNLEKKLARLLKKDRVILFPSGYQANSTTIPAILQLFPKDEVDIFSDKLNHKSILHGLQNTEINVKRYKNTDFNHLEHFLKNSNKKYKIVITESVFSMDGAVIDIQSLTNLKEKYGFFVYLDEAHSVGLYGKNGYGFVEDYPEIVDFAMGTFSKALASQGGYIAISEKIYHYLVNITSGLIYSTALTPSIIGTVSKVLDLLPSLDQKRIKLSEISSYFRNSAKNIGLNLPNTQSNIIPIIFQDRIKLDKIHSLLIENNIFSLKIKHPTVSENSERIRFSLNISHTKEDIDLVLNYLGNR